jgi:hypothetical protein
MDLMGELPGVLLGLMGWAATVLLIDGSSHLTVNDRRAMIVCSWMFWMIPGLGTLVLRGLLATDTAALTITFTTLALGAIMLLGSLVKRKA